MDKDKEYIEVDVEAFAQWLAEKDVKEYFKTTPQAVYTSEIEDGKVKQVYTEAAASWINTQIMVYKEAILTFSKPVDNE